MSLDHSFPMIRMLSFNQHISLIRVQILGRGNSNESCFHTPCQPQSMCHIGLALPGAPLPLMWHKGLFSLVRSHTFTVYRHEMYQSRAQPGKLQKLVWSLFLLTAAMPMPVDIVETVSEDGAGPLRPLWATNSSQSGCSTRTE